MKILIKDERPAGYWGLWCNKYGTCLENGDIVNFIRQLDNNGVMAIPYGDGLNEETVYGDYCGYDKDVILGVHCYRNPVNKVKNKLICFPLDDRCFRLGIKKVLEQDASNIYVDWNEKIPKVFWRGAGPEHFVRNRVMKELYGKPYSNVFYTRTPWLSEEIWKNSEYAKYYDPYYNGDPQPVPITEFIKHKYILIMDCFIISSSFQWVFGSGSVPILISHPRTEFWFKKIFDSFCKLCTD